MSLTHPPPLQMLENQVEVRQREVVELQSQVKALGQEVKDTDEVDGRRQLVERKFQELLDPLRRRRNFLVASREVHQFNRDVEDEIVRKTESRCVCPVSHFISNMFSEEHRGTIHRNRSLTNEKKHVCPALESASFHINKHTYVYTR